MDYRSASASGANTVDPGELTRWLGKSSLASQVLVELIAQRLGHELPPEEPESNELEHTTVNSTAWLSQAIR